MAADKPLLRIGEVARRTGLKPSTIRFYEQTFGFYLQTQRSPGGHRRYSEESVRKLLYLKYLLHTKGLSIRDVHQRLLREEDPGSLRRELDSLHQLVDVLVKEVHTLKAALEHLAGRLADLEDAMRQKGLRRFLFRAED